jgi:hypothetical protein
MHDCAGRSAVCITSARLSRKAQALSSYQWETRHMSYGYGPGPFGGGFFGNMRPTGPYGPWPTCGCSSIFIILAGMLLVLAGCTGLLGR